ncbi:MAG: type II secretion system protein [Kiritimatiellae bacterium]|nr:type II secretion system protein [Kiritimatiellia bacterium]
MKKAFTLLEVLIVMAILVILMTIAFSLGAISGDAEDKSCTILRMQRLENCLSGYYAAFGSYPPVKLHGSRNISTYVAHGDSEQDEDHAHNDIDWGNDSEDYEMNVAWAQVDAACRAQPVSCEFPLPDDAGVTHYIDGQAAEMTEYAMQDEIWKQLNETDKTVIWGKNARKTKCQGNWDSINKNPGRLSGKKDSSGWGDIKLFRFGLMSYLLPRYIVMMTGKKEFYTEYAQWTDNNYVPSDPLTGESNFGVGDGNVAGGWSAVWNTVNLTSENKTKRDLDMARLANIPSQAACARWMPNLENICKCYSHPVVYGVSLRSTRKRHGDNLDPFHYSNVHIRPYRPKGQSVGNQQYVINMITVRDGWGRDFYYYSPEPYQRYILWSAGANGKTFPPWIERQGLGAAGAKKVESWTHDDIMHMSK